MTRTQVKKLERRVNRLHPKPRKVFVCWCDILPGGEHKPDCPAREAIQPGDDVLYVTYDENWNSKDEQAT